MRGQASRSLLTVLIDLAIVVAVALTIRLFVLFTGQIAAQQWAKAYAAMSHYLVLPLGAHAIRTPYHGVFDVDAAMTVLVALVVEWGLSAVRDRA